MTTERKTIQVKPEIHSRLERMYNNEIGACLGVRSTSDLIEYLCDFYDQHNSAENILAMEVVKLIRHRIEAPLPDKSKVLVITNVPTDC
jgi:hypothetical protein